MLVGELFQLPGGSSSRLQESALAVAYLEGPSAKTWRYCFRSHILYLQWPLGPYAFILGYLDPQGKVVKHAESSVLLQPIEAPASWPLFKNSADGPSCPLSCRISEHL